MPELRTSYERTVTIRTKREAAMMSDRHRGRLKVSVAGMIVGAAAFFMHPHDGTKQLGDERDRDEDYAITGN